MKRQLKTAVRSVGPTITQFRLLIGSYAALTLILYFRIHPEVPRYVCLGLAVAGTVDTLQILWRSGQLSPAPRTVTEVDDVGAEIAGYFAAYLLPLLAAPAPDSNDLIAYAIFGLVIAVVSVRSNLFRINPTLYFLGWRVSQVTFKDEMRAYVISRREVRAGQQLQTRRIAGGVLRAE